MEKFKSSKNKKFNKSNQHSSKSKQSFNKPYTHSKYQFTKGTMSHIKGLPPSPTWSNKYSAVIVENNFLYIANNYLVNIDLKKKEFYQLIITETGEKLVCLCNLNLKGDFVIATTINNNFIIFQKYFNTNSPEDKRVYYREMKEKNKVINFPELEVNIQKDMNEIENINVIKVVKNISDKNILICGDSQGSIHAIKYFVKCAGDEYSFSSLEIKYSYSCLVSLNSSFITDILYIEDKNLIFISTSEGEISTYSMVNENLVKINLISKFPESFQSNIHSIFSMDYLDIPHYNIYLISIIDKNGSSLIFSLNKRSLLNDQNIETNSKKIFFFEKNKFNDKSVEEKYLFFLTKLIPLKNNEVKLIVTSNKGKLYWTLLKIDEILSDENDIDKVINLNYTEVSDNPHSMTIFNCLTYNEANKLLFISADKTISIFRSPEILFEFDIKTLGSIPKNLMVDIGNKNIFLFNEENHMYQYNHRKMINGLTCVLRKNVIQSKKKDKNKVKNKAQTKFDIIKSKQAKFNENIFALLVQKDKLKSIYSIMIYYFIADLKLNELKLDLNESCRIVDMIYYSNREYKDDILEVVQMRFQEEESKNQQLVENYGYMKKKENLINAVNELFSNSKQYELLYLLDSHGIITIWDYIYSKINRIKLFGYDEIINSASLIPLYNNLEHLFILSQFNDKIQFSMSNQSLFHKIYEKKVNTTTSGDRDYTINFKSLTDCYYDTSNKKLLILFIENFMDFKMYVFNLETIIDIEKDKEINKYTKLNYKDYIEVFSKITSASNTLLQEIIEFKNITNIEIKNLKVNHYYNTSPDKLVFITSQNDNVIKIYEVNFPFPSGNNNAKLILKYSINSHHNRVIDISWTDENRIVSTSLDHSLKLWDITLCKNLDLTICTGTNVNQVSNITNNLQNQNASQKIILINNINKINSSCLYQQPFKKCQEVINNFDIFYQKLINQKDFNSSIDEDFILSTIGDNLDMLLFSLFKSQELNFKLGKKIINIEIKNVLDSSNFNKYYPSLINLLLYAKKFHLNINLLVTEEMWKIIENKLSINIIDNQSIKEGQNQSQSQIINQVNSIEKLKKIINNFNNTGIAALSNNYSAIKWDYFSLLLIEDYDTAISSLIKNNLYAEAITLYKLAKLTDFALYLSILEKLKTFIYSKQAFQSQKCQKVIETLKNYFK